MKRKTQSASPETIAGMTRRRLLQTLGTGAVAATLGLALPESFAAPSDKPTPAPGETTLPPLPMLSVKPVVSQKALPFDMADVRLLDGPFQQAMTCNGVYLLSLEPDRLLSGFRTDAGLPPKAPVYGGWESEGLAGHTLGHYLSACALMYRSTGEPRFPKCITYIVGELALCQKANGTGYTAAIPNGKALFAQAAVDGTLKGWAPWYTIHKLMAGLRDSYVYCGNAQALDVLIGLAAWTDATTHALDDAQFQKMLLVEQGGMDEVLADVYALTGDTKYLALAHRFSHRLLLDPLAQRQDTLSKLHSNTQIPKIIGFGRIYELTGEANYGTAAQFFWQTVTETRSWVFGGNGDHEFFFPPDQFAAHLDSADTAETCCTYNMLKLTRQLFTQDPNAAHADYYERALYNQILASQDPVKGVMTYFSPTRPGHFKTYCDPTNAFWCCTGTGIENHAKYTDSIYFHDDHSLYVNLFIPSELKWREKGVRVRQETQFPSQDTTRLTLTCAKPTQLALRIRCPSWTQGMTLAVNGKRIPFPAAPSTYVTVDRIWHSGDVLEARLPMTLRQEPLPNAPDHVAFLFGPILLVAPMGRDGMDQIKEYAEDQRINSKMPGRPVPTLVAQDKAALPHIAPVPGKPLTFQTSGLGQPNDVTLVPYYALHHERYNMYWNVKTPQDVDADKAGATPQST
jgi:DUF1680 family protein